MTNFNMNRRSDSNDGNIVIHATLDLTGRQTLNSMFRDTGLTTESENEIDTDEMDAEFLDTKLRLYYKSKT